MNLSAMTSDDLTTDLTAPSLRDAAQQIALYAALFLANGEYPEFLVNEIGFLYAQADELDAGQPDVIVMAREAERKRADAADNCMRYRWLRSVGFKPRAILDQALKSMGEAADLDGGADQ